MGKWNTRTLCAMALLAALMVVLARFIVPMPSATMRFSIEAVPIVIGGLLFGPAAGALVGLVGDAAGTLFSPYGYNPVFAVAPVLTGLCAGMLRHLLYERVTYWRVLLTFLPAMALGSVVWQSWWLAFFYGSRTFAGFLGMRAVQFAITSIIDAAIIYGLFRSGIFEKLGFWPPAGKDEAR